MANTGNYYLNDLALQGRMKNVMDNLIQQFPYTHQGTFGGFSTDMHRGGETQGMERPNGNRNIGPRLGTDYGSHGQGFVDSENMNMIHKLEKRRGKKGMGTSGGKRGMGTSGGNVVGGRKMLSPERMHELEHDVASRGLGLSGGKRSSPWIQHVKNYAAKHGVSYKQAMSQAKASYKG